MYTKKLIILIICLCISFRADAQSYNYKKLSEFKNDTLSFLQYNFYEQQSYFIGRKFEKLLEVYRRELPIRNVAIIPSSPFIDPKGDSYVRATWITTMDETPVPPDTMHAVFTALFWVRFKEPYTVEYYGFCSSLPEDQTEEERANALKDFIIDYILVKPVDRRLLYRKGSK